MKLRKIIIALLVISSLFGGCQKEKGSDRIKSNYTGTYKNIAFTEQLVQTYTTGIYYENEIPDNIKTLNYGRIEIDFYYNSGALTYFSPLFYYGSINKNTKDDNTEKPKFNIAIELGHYNVIPVAVEHLFYTISTYRQPQYCRDTYCPVIPGINYTMVIDKRPEGIILQLRKGDAIVNIFPHAFFPDSSQMFFNDISSYIDTNRGDSLQKVLMVGKGFAGIEEGIHEVRGGVSSVRIYKYSLSSNTSEYEMRFVRNQHTENQDVTYILKDVLKEEDKSLILRYEYWPYKYESGQMTPDGAMQSGESQAILNSGQLQFFQLTDRNIGLYKLYPHTVNNNLNTLAASDHPFEIWVYPKEWNFDFYKK